MGLGASLAFIAIGAILAFALRVELSGIDIQMVGWILILVGVFGLAFTLMYTRPRSRASTAEVIEEEPLYVVHPEEPVQHVHGTHTHEPVREEPIPPHVHTDQPTAPAPEPTPEPPQPGRYIREGRRAPHERL